MNIIIRDLKEFEEFAKKFAGLIEFGDVYSLIGDLGAGKTTFVQSVGRQLGIDDYITSPTFSIVNIYEADQTIYHLDLYRLESPEELEQLDYESYFYPEGISFIEWAIKGEGYLPEDMIKINITIRQDGGRDIEIIEDNDRAKEIVKELE